jgi:hypothetical protein
MTHLNAKPRPTTTRADQYSARGFLDRYCPVLTAVVFFTYLSYHAT